MFHKILILLYSFFLRCILGLIFITCDWKIHNKTSFKLAQKNLRPIFLCCWHSRFILVAYYFKRIKLNIWAVSSTHRDSEIMANLLIRWGFRLIRGSSTRGWTNVIKKMIKLFKKPHSMIAITNDGPKGPPLIAKKGSAMLAYKYNAQILSVSAAPSRFWTLKTWDRAIIPKPFSTIHIRFGDCFQGFKKEIDEVGDISEYINYNFNLLNQEIYK